MPIKKMVITFCIYYLTGPETIAIWLITLLSLKILIFFQPCKVVLAIPILHINCKDSIQRVHLTSLRPYN